LFSRLFVELWCTERRQSVYEVYKVYVLSRLSIDFLHLIHSSFHFSQPFSFKRNKKEFRNDEDKINAGMASLYRNLSFDTQIIDLTNLEDLLNMILSNILW